MEHIFTDSNFDAEVIKSEVPVMVDFWAPWCGPCRALSPVIEELAEEMDGAKVKIGKVNVDENSQLAQAYSIMTIPTLMVFRGGKVAEQLTGALTKQALLDKLSKYLG